MPELGLRERKKLLTRQLIADTARRLFAERGFEAVPVAEIARAADVSEQTVFNYFPTKEDLVFWRLGTFEDELLATIRDRPDGESALQAFGRFLGAQRGLLGQVEPDAREQLRALSRVIASSPALRAREAQILAGYTDSLASLLAEESGQDGIRPWVAANAMLGVHRALIDFTRRRVIAGESGPALQRVVRAELERALALLEQGL